VPKTIFGAPWSYPENSYLIVAAISELYRNKHTYGQTGSQRKLSSSSSSCILFQAARPIKHGKQKDRQTKEAYKYTDKMR